MSSNLKSALKAIDAFSELSDASFADLATLCKQTHAPSGTILFSRGDQAIVCYGVVKGVVTIQESSSSTSIPDKILGRMERGMLFGESALFEDGTRNATAVIERDADLIEIDGVKFRQWVDKDPAKRMCFMLQLFQTTLTRLGQTNRELSLVYGLGRILSSTKEFEERMTMATHYLYSSIEGLDEITLFRRSAYWEELSPVTSIPPRPGIDSLTLTLTPELQALTPEARTLSHATIQTLGLPALWKKTRQLAIIPLVDLSHATPVLKGALLAASMTSEDCFKPHVLYLFTTLAPLFMEALIRQDLAEESIGKQRLNQSKTSHF